MERAATALHDMLRIDGGLPLRGDVSISGAKNAALPAMAAALLTDQPVVIENVPEIGDVGFMADLLRAFGATVEVNGGEVRITAAEIHSTSAPTEIVRHLRASFLVMGALLGGHGEASCAPPGGDVIGQRPLDVHFAGFLALGAEVGRRGEQYHAVAPGGRLRGARIFLDYPSHLGTENVLLAAVRAEGETVIVNAAAEPEIAFLADMLNSMGACIRGAGTHTIHVTGVPELHGTRVRVLPDRIEAGTFAMAAAATGGDVRVVDADPRHLDALLAKLQELGAAVEEFNGGFRVLGAPSYRAITAQALPYPGLATDLQAPLAALLTRAEGVSLVHERVYDNRMLYLGELRKFGAEVTSAGSTAIITGGPLVPANARALDIRAGAALMIAALIAPGTSTITDVYHLDRGYTALAAKLTKLGASVRRVSAQG